MVFFAQKVLRKVAGNWTFVVVTDRVELDDQIAKTFKATGAVSEAEGDQCHAESGAHLRELLRGNHRYVFTLIHKFRPENLLPLPAKNERGEDRGGRPDNDSPLSDSLHTRASRGERENGVMPVLCDRPDVIVLTDEAHRSQYDTLALNMRAALPKALFLAFTGTPLIAGEERTKDVLGDYVSIYDFQQSVEDGATVPLSDQAQTIARHQLAAKVLSSVTAQAGYRRRAGCGSATRVPTRALPAKMFGGVRALLRKLR
jgi:type I restriction enzyme R subunit